MSTKKMILCKGCGIACEDTGGWQICRRCTVLHERFAPMLFGGVEVIAFTEEEKKQLEKVLVESWSNASLQRYLTIGGFTMATPTFPSPSTSDFWSGFQRFTDRERRALQLANQEAQRLNHGYIGTEHVLIGIIKEGDGVACWVLKNLLSERSLKTGHGWDSQILKAVRDLLTPGPEMVSMGKLPLTSRVLKACDYAKEEAQALGHTYVGTEHLLLGLLREEDGVASQVLKGMGLGTETVRAEMMRLLTPQHGQQEKQEEIPTKEPERVTCERCEAEGIPDHMGNCRICLRPMLCWGHPKKDPIVQVPPEKEDKHFAPLCIDTTLLEGARKRLMEWSDLQVMSVELDSYIKQGKPQPPSVPQCETCKINLPGQWKREGEPNWCHVHNPSPLCCHHCGATNPKGLATPPFCNGCSKEMRPINTVTDPQHELTGKLVYMCCDKSQYILVGQQCPKCMPQVKKEEQVKFDKCEKCGKTYCPWSDKDKPKVCGTCMEKDVKSSETEKERELFACSKCSNNVEFLYSNSDSMVCMECYKEIKRKRRGGTQETATILHACRWCNKMESLVIGEPCPSCTGRLGVQPKDDNGGEQVKEERIVGTSCGEVDTEPKAVPSMPMSRELVCAKCGIAHALEICPTQEVVRLGDGVCEEMSAEPKFITICPISDPEEIEQAWAWMRWARERLKVQDNWIEELEAILQQKSTGLDTLNERVLDLEVQLRNKTSESSIRAELLATQDRGVAELRKNQTAQAETIQNFKNSGSAKNARILELEGFLKECKNDRDSWKIKADDFLKLETLARNDCTYWSKTAQEKVYAANDGASKLRTLQTLYDQVCKRRDELQVHGKNMEEGARTLNKALDERVASLEKAEKELILVRKELASYRSVSGNWVTVEDHNRVCERHLAAVKEEKDKGALFKTNYEKALKVLQDTTAKELETVRKDAEKIRSELIYEKKTVTNQASQLAHLRDLLSQRVKEVGECRAATKVHADRLTLSEKEIKEKCDIIKDLGQRLETTQGEAVKHSQEGGRVQTLLIERNKLIEELKKELLPYLAIGKALQAILMPTKPPLGTDKDVSGTSRDIKVENKYMSTPFHIVYNSTSGTWQTLVDGVPRDVELKNGTWSLVPQKKEDGGKV